MSFVVNCNLFKTLVMSTKGILYSISLLTLIILSGCYSSEIAQSKDVNQEQIHQAYYINVDEETGSYRAEAVYRFGGNKGTTLILSSPASIRLNGDTMSGISDPIRGYYYVKNIFSTDTNSFKFEYTNTQGKICKNAVSFGRIKLIELPDSFSKARKLKIKWEGEPVMSNESVYLIITAQENTSTRISTDLKGDRKIIVTPEQMAGLKAGNGTIQIVREVEKALDKGTELGGLMNAEYSSKIYEVRITE
jgi:hypothetical protein